MPGAATRVLATAGVLCCGELDPAALAGLAARFGARSVVLGPGSEIPGSYWGAPEAGLVGAEVYLRDDTPAHSLLHELAHFVCMDPTRRSSLDTDAGGDDLEECAVCYLEVLLADRLAGYSSERCLGDMDRWGYSFREGSAARWFHGDGREARAWLVAAGLVHAHGQPTWRLRTQSLVGFGASP